MKEKITKDMLKDAIEICRKEGKVPSRVRLMEMFNIKEATARKLYGILENLNLFLEERIFLKIPAIKDKIRIGAISDLHIGSKSCYEEMIIEYLKIANERTDVLFIAGDIIDGVNVYRGQEFDLKLTQIQEQIERAKEILNIYEKQIYFITGNHEEVVYNMAGIEVGNLLKGDKRVYLGSNLAGIKINGLKVDLWHGRGRGAYALSYKMQKLIEQYLSGKKPHIVFEGHWHRAFHMPIYRNVDGFECGTFQGETRLTKQMGVFPQTGGWLIEVEIAEDYTPVVVGGRFWRFYV